MKKTMEVMGYFFIFRKKIQNSNGDDEDDDGGCGCGRWLVAGSDLDSVGSKAVDDDDG